MCENFLKVPDILDFEEIIVYSNRHRYVQSSISVMRAISRHAEQSRYILNSDEYTN